MKLLLSLCCFLLLTAQTCQKTQTDLAPAIFKHWVHSFEEDKTGIQTYRPALYNFPLARGREGFEVKDNGTFILHRIGPADKIEKADGSWTSAGKNKIKVRFNNLAIAPFTIQLIQANDTLLTLKKINN